MNNSAQSILGEIDQINSMDLFLLARFCKKLLNQNISIEQQPKKLIALMSIINIELSQKGFIPNAFSQIELCRNYNGQHPFVLTLNQLTPIAKHNPSNVSYISIPLTADDLAILRECYIM